MFTTEAGKPRKTMKKIKVNKRDLSLLWDIHENDCLTAEVIQATRFEGQKVDAMKSFLRRLGPSGGGLIKSEKVTGAKFVIYRLTNDGAKEIGVKYSGKAIGSSNLPRRYAMQWLTKLCKDGVEREICKPKRHKDLFKFGNNRLPKVDFYIANYNSDERAEGNLKLGLAVVDFKSRTERIVQRTVKHLRRFSRHGWFDSLIMQGCFEVTVLTGSEKKKLSIDLRMANQLTKKLRGDFARLNPQAPLKLPFSYQVLVAPRLFEFVPTTGPNKQTKKGGGK